ncbi:proteoglycan 4 isoform X2 [Folsomia candida]|uniref:proteoglycan 4 isoform X2 n=1 Tax=Folsomia candida TaxID=158441 RepID=UPI00160531A0|nr:proteoglycan 4 isoform X2 [Folsomia candida]
MSSSEESLADSDDSLPPSPPSAYFRTDGEESVVLGKRRKRIIDPMRFAELRKKRPKKSSTTTGKSDSSSDDSRIPSPSDHDFDSENVRVDQRKVAQVLAKSRRVVKQMLPPPPKRGKKKVAVSKPKPGPGRDPLHSSFDESLERAEIRKKINMNDFVAKFGKQKNTLNIPKSPVPISPPTEEPAMPKKTYGKKKKSSVELPASRGRQSTRTNFFRGRVQTLNDEEDDDNEDDEWTPIAKRDWNRNNKRVPSRPLDKELSALPQPSETEPARSSLSVMGRKKPSVSASQQLHDDSPSKTKRTRGKPKIARIGTLSNHINNVVSSPDFEPTPLTQPTWRPIRRTSVLTRTRENNSVTAQSLVSYQSQSQSVYGDILSQHLSQPNNSKQGEVVDLPLSQRVQEISATPSSQSEVNQDPGVADDSASHDEEVHSSSISPIPRPSSVATHPELDVTLTTQPPPETLHSEAVSTEDASSPAPTEDAEVVVSALDHQEPSTPSTPKRAPTRSWQEPEVSPVRRSSIRQDPEAVPPVRRSSTRQQIISPVRRSSTRQQIISPVRRSSTRQQVISPVRRSSIRQDPKGPHFDAVSTEAQSPTPTELVEVVVSPLDHQEPVVVGPLPTPSTPKQASSRSRQEHEASPVRTSSTRQVISPVRRPSILQEPEVVSPVRRSSTRQQVISPVRRSSIRQDPESISPVGRPSIRQEEPEVVSPIRRSSTRQQVISPVRRPSIRQEPEVVSPIRKSHDRGEPEVVPPLRSSRQGQLVVSRTSTTSARSSLRRDPLEVVSLAPRSSTGQQPVASSKRQHQPSQPTSALRASIVPIVSIVSIVEQEIVAPSAPTKQPEEVIVSRKRPSSRSETQQQTHEKNSTNMGQSSQRHPTQISSRNRQSTEEHQPEIPSPNRASSSRNQSSSDEGLSSQGARRKRFTWGQPQAKSRGKATEKQPPAVSSSSRNPSQIAEPHVTITSQRAEAPTRKNNQRLEATSSSDEEGQPPKKRVRQVEQGNRNSWGPDHPIMQGRGKALYNKRLVSEDLIKETIEKYVPDTTLTGAQLKTLHGNMNAYIETTFNDLCDNTPLYFGVWTFQQLMARLKRDGLLNKTATRKDFVALLNDTIGEEEASKCEGLLFPKRGESDTLRIFT